MKSQVRFAERFVTLREAGDEYRLLSAFESLRLRTENGGNDLLSRVLPLLRDGVAEERLRSVVGPQDVANVDLLLSELLGRGLVERVEAGDALVSVDRRLASQVRFLANFPPFADVPPLPDQFPRPSGSETQARIARAQVALIGSGDLLGRVEAQLTRAGLVAMTTVDIDDQDSDARLRAAIRGSELVVVCPDHQRVSLLRDLNRMCLEAGRTWTSARTIGSRVEVGPTIVPGDTACFGCYELRRQSNDAGYRDGAERAELLAVDGLDTGRLAIEVADGLLAAEVLKLVGGFSRPMTYGALFSLDLVTLESGLHPVLKIPRCASCGAPARNRPTTSVWPFTP